MLWVVVIQQGIESFMEVIQVVEFQPWVALISVDLIRLHST